MERWICGDLLSGEYWLDLPVSKGVWSAALGEAERIDATIGVPQLDLGATTIDAILQPWRTYLAVVVDDVVVAAGPITQRRYSSAEQAVTFTARGLKTWADRRLVLPVAGRTQPLYDVANKASNPVTNTALAGAWSDVVRRLGQQAVAWGASPPILFENPVGGDRHYAVEGIDLHRLSEAFDTIAGRADGVEYRFRPSWQTDARTHVVWVLEAAPDATQLLADGLVELDLLADCGISDVRIDEDAAHVCTRAYVPGGKGTDEVLTGVHEDTPAGMPLLEHVDGSWTSESTQGVLEARAAALVAEHPQVSITLGVRIDLIPSHHMAVGNWCLLHADLPLLGAGGHQLRITAITATAGDPVWELRLTPAAIHDRW